MLHQRAKKQILKEAASDGPQRKNATVRATFPGGRVEVHPDDGRSYPSGMMLQWSDRWTIVGCAWPFDD